MHTSTHSPDGTSPNSPGQGPQPGIAFLERLDNGIAVLSLGAPGESKVTLTRERMTSIREALGKLESSPPRGLVIIGTTPDMFTMGADLTMAKSVVDSVKGEELGRVGQEVFSRLQRLSCYKVAAMSGPALGGGCELALACDYRIISDHKSSQIGLPEVTLGILPGWGGTQRLPKLIGLPKALDIILNGKRLKPKQALAVGLVNEIEKADALRSKAIQVALGAAPRREVKISFADKALTSIGFLRNLVVKKQAEASIHKATKGFYPAPKEALRVTLEGLSFGNDHGYREEAKALGRLLVSPECKSLIHIFFVSEASKAIGRSAKGALDHVQGLIVGAGAMGAGIAEVMARNNSNVILRDINEAALERGINQIKTSLGKSKWLSEVERNEVLNRVQRTTGDSPAFGSVNVVVEAALEQMEVKKKIFGDIVAKIPPEAIVTTNTSSLSVSEMATSIPNPERFAGLHFFNPVPKMPLVEIVRGKETSARTVAVLAALVTKMGKFPIVVEDVPGFLVNRVLSPYLNEAAYLLMEGYSVEDIDRAALKFGMPMGPVRLLDEVGLDIAAHVADSMERGYPDRMKAPLIAKKMVEAKRLGKKSKLGFYDFSGEKEVATNNYREALGITAAPKTNPSREEITDRLILALVNEAVRSLDEGVAGRPGKEAAEQIDLGTVMGIGFPPFRGGILMYAQTRGIKSILEVLKGLKATVGDRFTPAPGIATRASSGKGFYESIS